MGIGVKKISEMYKWSNSLYQTFMSGCDLTFKSYIKIYCSLDSKMILTVQGTMFKLVLKERVKLVMYFVIIPYFDHFLDEFLIIFLYIFRVLDEFAVTRLHFCVIAIYRRPVEHLQLTTGNRDFACLVRRPAIPWLLQNL